MNAGFLEIINHGQEEKIRLLQNKVDLYSANLEQYKQKSYSRNIFKMWKRKLFRKNDS